MYGVDMQLAVFGGRVTGEVKRKFRWALVCLIAVVVLGVAARGDDLNRVTIAQGSITQAGVFVADGEERGANNGSAGRGGR